MGNEEIIAKFGSDTTGFERGRQQVISGTQKMGQEAHKSFVHASNGAREFHKLLHGIGEQSPLLGTALRAAISPIAGLFAGISLAITYVNSQLEELNKRFDELGRSAEQPLYNIVNLLHNARLAAQRFNEEYFNWKNKPRKDEDIEFMEEKLALMKLQVAEASKLDPSKAKALEKASVQTQFDMQARELSRTGIKMSGAEANADSAARAMGISLRDPIIPKAQAVIRANQQTISDLNKEIDRVETAISARKNALVPALPTEGLEAYADKMKGLRKAAEKRIEENNTTIERETNERKKIADAVAETKGIYDSYKQQFEALSKQLEGTRQHLSIITGVGNPEHTGDLPSTVQRLNLVQNNRAFNQANLAADRDQAMQDWRKSRGLSWHEVHRPINANQTPGDVKTDMQKLNELFSGIVTTDGMKVNFTIKDD